MSSSVRVDLRGDAEPSALARQFALLVPRLVVASTAGEVLTLLVRAAQRLLPAADSISVTVRAGHDGTLHTPVSLGPAAAELDRIQYDTGEGPCIDASRMTRPGVAAGSDLATTRAWPGFGAAATARGIGAVVSCALAPEPATAALGALNVYARRSHALDAGHDAALLLATHAALALAHAQALSYAELQHGRLVRAAHSR